MVVLVLCIAWLTVSLPLGMLLGYALRRADADPARDHTPDHTRPTVSLG